MVATTTVTVVAEGAGAGDERGTRTVANAAGAVVSAARWLITGEEAGTRLCLGDE